MAKNRNLINNNFYNFKLRGTPSILIGLYIILGSISIETVIKGFYTDSSPFGFLTVNYLEVFIFIITLLTFLFSLLALFFGNRRYARKIGNKVWNYNSKKSILFLTMLIIVIYFILFYLLRIGKEAFILPTFLIYYGFILIFLNFSKKTAIYYLAITSFIVGFLPLLYPNYGLNSILIFGIAHMVFGLTIKR